MKRENHKIVRTTTWSAGPGCYGGCGVLAHIKYGKPVKIEGDPDHPWNQGRLCARCLAMTQYAYHPDRLPRPLKRVGECGEGKQALYKIGKYATISSDRNLVNSAGEVTKRASLPAIHGHARPLALIRSI
jgi:hypothetical protein